MSVTADILEKPRWGELRQFVERWYAEPLGQVVFNEVDLDTAERKLGRAMPTALREWFLLVGHRLCDVNQDRPERLHELERRGQRLPIWWENQGNWSVDVEMAPATDEPWASVESDEESWCRREPLSRALLGMVYSDTLVGAWAKRGVGPLGTLAPSVVAGIQDATPAAEARFDRLPPLDVMTNPYFDEPMRGSPDLVIRRNGGSLEWMASTREAAAAAHAVLAG